MMLEPLIRIVLRYGVGLIFGMEAGEYLAGDPDLVMLIASGVTMIATEGWWWWARKTGRDT